MIYSKKHSHIKKQVIAQKCNNLLRTNKYVLFFHYNGGAKGGYNWQHVKKTLGVSYKSLLVPSKMCGHTANSKKGGILDKNRAHFLPLAPAFYPLFQGGALLVACSSPAQMAVILEKCSSPTFLCIGGAFRMSPMSHLDIKRWVSLKTTSTQAHADLCTSLVEKQKVFLSLSTSLLNLPFLSTGPVFQRLLLLLRLLERKKHSEKTL